MEKKFAVFIDGDNISAHDYDAVITEIASYGDIVIKRVYGDWTTTNMNMWKEKIVKNPAVVFQEFRAGKNATDTRIIMDAIEMAIQNASINAFCVVSTDADYFGLALRLRANGKYVLGLGKAESKQIWQDSCDKFVVIDKHLCVAEPQNKDPDEGVGIIQRLTNTFGFIQHEHGRFYFKRKDIVESFQQKIKEGSRVKFRIVKYPDSTKKAPVEKNGNATEVSAAS